MKKMKKSLMLVVAAMAFCFMLSFSTKASADSIGISGGKLYFDLTYHSGYGYQVQILSKAKKKISTKTVSSYASFSVKKNKIYYYRVRLVRDPYGDRTAASDWTKARPVATIKSYKISAPSRKLKIRVPKYKGITYNIYMSTKKSSGYKKIKTLKPGKSYTISKYKGKKFALYKTYYYKITPVYKKRKSVISYAGSVRFYRVYK